MLLGSRLRGLQSHQEHGGLCPGSPELECYAGAGSGSGAQGLSVGLYSRGLTKY